MPPSTAKARGQDRGLYTMLLAATRSRRALGGGARRGPRRAPWRARAGTRLAIHIATRRRVLEQARAVLDALSNTVGPEALRARQGGGIRLADGAGSGSQDVAEAITATRTDTIAYEASGDTRWVEDATNIDARGGTVVEALDRSGKRCVGRANGCQAGDVKPVGWEPGVDCGQIGRVGAVTGRA